MTKSESDQLLDGYVAVGYYTINPGVTNPTAFTCVRLSFEDCMVQASQGRSRKANMDRAIVALSILVGATLEQILNQLPPKESLGLGAFLDGFILHG